MPVPHKQPGDPFQFRAAHWNHFADAANAYAEGRFDRLPRYGRGPQDATIVYVRNQTPADVPYANVLQLGNPLLAVAPSNKVPAFEGLQPSHDVVEGLVAGHRPVATLLQPIKKDAIGLAQIGGCHRARVNYNNRFHRFARPAPGTTVLQSARQGPFYLYDNTQPLGERLRWVRPSGRITPGDGQIWVRNDHSSINMHAFRSVGLRQPLIEYEENENPFFQRERIWAAERLRLADDDYAGTKNDWGRFVVLLETIAPGEIGLAQAAGLTVARLSLLSGLPWELQPRADVGSTINVSNSLRPNWVGAAEILWLEKEEGISRGWALLKIGSFVAPPMFGRNHNTIAAGESGSVELRWKGELTGHSVTAHYDGLVTTSDLPPQTEMRVEFERERNRWTIIDHVHVEED